MKWYYNLKTSVKLVSAFLIIAVILAVVGITGMTNLGKMNTAIREIYDNNLVPITNLSESKALYQKLRVSIRDMAYIATTDEENKTYQDQIKMLQSEIEAKVDQYRQNNQLTQPEQEILKEFDPTWESYDHLLGQAVQLNIINDQKGFTELLQGELLTVGDRLQNILKNLVDLNIKIADQTSINSDKLYASSRITTIVIIVVAFLISIAFGFYISMIISRPLKQTVVLVGQVAKGDLRETSKIDTQDEVGQLAASINDMIENLRSTVGNIQASSESVSAASQQISASTEEIASGSTSQANSAQIINELFKELSEAINSVANGAEQASDLSSRTVDIAQDGGKVVQSAIEGMTLVSNQMSRLEQDSNQIGEIIEVIDDIAEQTNLLALNAAIEAARAGDQGRGFAVVADEVRKLAERSGEATKQITSIIKGMQENTRQSVKAVEEGVVSSQKTGEAFENIVAIVNDSANKVSEIAAACEEQAAQSSEVLSSIESISAATEEAAASSEQTASTAQSLAHLAEELNHSVSMFQVK